MQTAIKQALEQAVKKLQADSKLPTFEDEAVAWAVMMTEDLKFGDFTSNIGMQLAPVVRMKPAEITALLADQLKSTGVSMVEKIEGVNGYLNFYFQKERLLTEMGQIIEQKENYGASQLGKGHTVVIDYSAPNIAKAFGIGHLRSTIIGQALYNLYIFLGYQCVGDNHLGDWGTQFGKLIYQIKAKQLDLSGIDIESLERVYVDFHSQAKDNPVLEEEARAWFKKLEEGDKEATAIWEKCKEISLKEFDRIYELLGVKIDHTLGESFYQDKMPAIFEELQQKELVKKSEGAWVMEFNDETLPTLPVIKSDGATTYFLRDLATIKYRVQTWQPSLIIYEVGVDQSLHFRQLFRAVELLGWSDNLKLVHVAHGLMRSAQGKFSTRKGETIHLEDVLKEAISKAKETIEHSETDKGLSEQEKAALAQQVGIGAIKYNDLSQYHGRDIIFDWAKALNLKGNSGPYLQYTFARCQSVLRKAGGVEKQFTNAVELNPEERQLLQQMMRFADIIKQAAELYSPNLLCNYLYNLAQDFNLFYAKHSILNDADQEQQALRLAITAATAQVIKNGLTLLGIATPAKM